MLHHTILVIRILIGGTILALTVIEDAGCNQSLAQQIAQQIDPDPTPLVVYTARGKYSFSIEIADEPGEQIVGLMFRETMATDRGMLFVHDVPHIITMWMRNTPLSLDMVFLTADGQIAHIAERTEPFSLDTISSQGPASHVLEINAGVAALAGMEVGDRVLHPLFDNATNSQYPQ